MVDKYTQSNWERRISLWFFYFNLRIKTLFSRHLFHLPAESGIYFNLIHAILLVCNSNCKYDSLSLFTVLPFTLGALHSQASCGSFSADFDKEFNCLSSFEIHCHYKTGVIIAYGPSVISNAPNRMNEWKKEREKNRSAYLINDPFKSTMPVNHNLLMVWHIFFLISREIRNSAGNGMTSVASYQRIQQHNDTHCNFCVVFFWVCFDTRTFQTRHYLFIRIS